MKSKQNQTGRLSANKHSRHKYKTENRVFLTKNRIKYKCTEIKCKVFDRKYSRNNIRSDRSISFGKLLLGPNNLL